MFGPNTFIHVPNCFLGVINHYTTLYVLVLVLVVAALAVAVALAPASAVVGVAGVVRWFLVVGHWCCRCWCLNIRANQLSKDNHWGHASMVENLDQVEVAEGSKCKVLVLWQWVLLNASKCNDSKIQTVLHLKHICDHPFHVGRHKVSDLLGHSACTWGKDRIGE